MAKKVRKQVYIESDQDKLLRKRAKEIGVSQAELIRQSIGQLGRLTPELLRDHKAWEEAKEFIRKERMGVETRQTGRTWTREELYDERLGHISN